ncbi:hypothetical protein TCDM_11119 [Trypanosoma cruzi Dm28c]|uniref:Uncharacterized protein n=1 Tax=Trypanosoma cruzi Dm28c TaxID=1416333 RepID=V5BA87_TRYCR|nr:hypothetical protein TCDM_11119 [Trypanosoma cruzi Dm28c]
MPCRNHSHRETRKSVWMCAESTATVIVRGGHRDTVRHASAQKEQRTHPAVQKQRGEENDPKSRQHLHTWRASCSRVAISARDASQRPAVAKNIHAERCANNYFLCAGKAGKRSTGRHIKTARGTAGWQRYMRCSLNINNHGRWKHTSSTKNKRKGKKNTAAGCGCVCGAAGVCPPWPQRKTKQEERNVCAAPQALVARPHVTAPSARRSSRPLLMRAAGEAHRAVVMSVSVGVRVEQLGGNTRHPSQKECGRNN